MLTSVHHFWKFWYTLTKPTEHQLLIKLGLSVPTLLSDGVPQPRPWPETSDEV